MNIPDHIAIIMDGNGRWAKKRLLPRVEGHKRGVKTLENVLYKCKELGVKYLTVYAFSTENWNRPEKEVNELMNLFLKFLQDKKDELKEKNVKLLITGSKKRLSTKIIEEIEKTENYLKDCSGITLNIAFNYGGRLEIVESINKILEKNIEEIDEKEFQKYLYRPEIPDPDLLIRTSGEFRLSNFLLWQIAYSEIYISKKLWPNFKEEDLIKSIESFKQRERKFGGLKKNDK